MRHGHSTRAGKRGLRIALGGTLLATALSGCASTWDDLTAYSPQGGFRNDMNYRFALLFDSRPPLETLAESNDGDLRAKAYRKLKEPLQGGGTQEDQKMMVELLAAAAKSEKYLVCRVAAAEKLGEFQDPAATQALTDAFYAPTNVGEKTPVVRVAVVNALAKKNTPESIKLMTEAVARDPAMDVRMAAADGLGHHPSPEAATALLQVLQSEKDVALRYTVATSLKKITGKDLPPKADEWQAYLQQPGAIKTADARPGLFDFDLQLASWWR